ncbi:MAG: hypothetical protein CME63_13895 [Halobacteriovoraceae bacterium]|nr:hypothetical protein [Halobacteriovoraceae bacterium]|tara:strand:+ start:16670 stop:17665 length:996 start_codon:yes stop_codon:yes gene_type:complete
MSDIKGQSAVEIMANVLSIEAYAINKAADRLSEDSAHQLMNLFQELIVQKGSLIFCGVGKSGIIGQKLAATFSSLGLPSFFLHPTEALHGDLGMVRSEDAIVLISYSGTAEEILKLIPFLKIEKNKRVALVGKEDSPIVKESGIFLDCYVNKEACVNNQAPTTSSTLTMAMGDAMAVLYENIIGLSREGFALNHPGGRLGKSLRLKVGDLMIAKDKCPCLSPKQTLKEAIVAMTDRPVGACFVLNDKEEIEGLLVDGDIKRFFSKDNLNLESDILSLMNKSPITISQDELAVEGLKLMEEGKRPFSLLPVVDADQKFVGVLRLHDLFKEGL